MLQCHNATVPQCHTAQAITIGSRISRTGRQGLLTLWGLVPLVFSASWSLISMLSSHNGTVGRSGSELRPVAKIHILALDGLFGSELLALDSLSWQTWHDTDD